MSFDDKISRVSTSGVMEPSGRGGVAITMTLHPAMAAGMASMSVLLGSTAVPPGTYTPTEPAASSATHLDYFPTEKNKKVTQDPS